MAVFTLTLLAESKAQPWMVWAVLACLALVFVGLNFATYLTHPLKAYRAGRDEDIQLPSQEDYRVIYRAMLGKVIYRKSLCAALSKNYLYLEDRFFGMRKVVIARFRIPREILEPGPTRWEFIVPGEDPVTCYLEAFKVVKRPPSEKPEEKPDQTSESASE